MNDIAIKVNNVSKCYRLFDNQVSRLLHLAYSKRINGMVEIWALKNINLEIKKGEAVAIIGRNGGGKSTLLEILTGTLTPSIGSVKVNGRVSALLELGSGFNPEYSGRDNVILNGLLLGLGKDEIISRFSEIEAFAEIGTAIEHPVKTYSSGMLMRLAFAVQVICDPDILIIDEALGVGDFFFQSKCIKYIRELLARGVTLLFVSHDMQMVRDLCSKAIFLEAGKVAYFGESISAIHAYMGVTKRDGDEMASPDNGMLEEGVIFSQLSSTKSSYIKKIEVYDEDGRPALSVAMGSRLTVKVRYCANQNDEPFHISMLILNRLSQLVYSGGTYTNGFNIEPGELSVKFTISFPIEAGEYGIQFNAGIISELGVGEIIDETPLLGPISVCFDYSKVKAPFYGQYHMPVVIESC